MTPIPIIERTRVGVKLPVSGGVGVAEAVAVDLGVDVGLIVGVAEAVVGVADGVETKAGPSEAWTIKSLVRFLSIP